MLIYHGTGWPHGRRPVIVHPHRCATCGSCPQCVPNHCAPVIVHPVVVHPWPTTPYWYAFNAAQTIHRLSGAS